MAHRNNESETVIGVTKLPRAGCDEVFVAPTTAILSANANVLDTINTA
jgi:hypothetical protein